MEKTETSEKLYRYLFIGIWIILVVWRFYILFSYCYGNVDDDQAVMWYGTVHFAHGHFPEPCFFGQDYNTMLESLLAVPLYLCGWPLNYALPTVTALLCLIPFVYCSVSCYRRKRMLPAFLVALLFGISAWQWDVMTSIPRSFISGFPFAVIGAGLMCEPEGKAIKRAVGAFMCAIGAVMTMSAVALLGIALLDNVLTYRTKWKKYMVSVLGMIPAAGWYAYQKWYYSVHIGDIITKSGIDPLDRYVFELSIENLPQLLRETFGFGNATIVLVPFTLIAAAIYLFVKKRWRELILLLVAVAGSIFAMSFGWMQVYEEGCILFGKSRMVLFWIFLVLELILLFSFGNDGDEKERKPIVFFTAAVCFIMVGVKAVVFSGEVKDPDSTIYRNGIIRVMPVDELKKQSAAIVEVAEAAQADVLVTTAYSHVMAYGAGALYYDKPLTFYIPDRDRRVWVFNELLTKKDSRMLLYSMPVDSSTELTLIPMEDQSVPEFFSENYGIERGGKYEWGMR